MFIMSANGKQGSVFACRPLFYVTRLWLEEKNRGEEARRGDDEVTNGCTPFHLTYPVKPSSGHGK